MHVARVLQGIILYIKHWGLPYKANKPRLKNVSVIWGYFKHTFKG